MYGLTAGLCWCVEELLWNQCQLSKASGKAVNVTKWRTLLGKLVFVAGVIGLKRKVQLPKSLCPVHRTRGCLVVRIPGRLLFITEWRICWVGRDPSGHQIQLISAYVKFMVLVWWQRKAGLLCGALQNVGNTMNLQQRILMEFMGLMFCARAGPGEQYSCGALPQCVVLLLVRLFYSFVHRTESVSSPVKPLRILLVKVQAFVAPVLWEDLDVLSKIILSQTAS